VPQELPSFDLVVATIGRTDELAELLDSLRTQTHRDLRVVVVDQNEDDRVGPLLAASGVETLRLQSASGLSRARNAALPHLRADVVAFPDDDCAYPPDLLAGVARRLTEHPELDGVTGRVEDSDGRSSRSWKTDRALLDRSNLWNRANSATMFLRRELVDRIGPFDEELGLGSGKPWESGEEIDYLVRALDAGARIEYDPSLVIRHALVPDDPSVGARDGATVGYLLRKHGYPARTRARMLVRPIGGALVAVGHRDLGRARYYAAAFRGRLRGLRRQ
jgi:glycosyltransferase involved in cell wall biosynthesis